METGATSKARYTSRINRVFTFITNHLDEPLTLDILAREACFSPYHFHRLFTALVGETPGAVVIRLRLEKAAKMLVRNPAASITDIAFTCSSIIVCTKNLTHPSWCTRVYSVAVRYDRDVTVMFQKIVS